MQRVLKVQKVHSYHSSSMNSTITEYHLNLSSDEQEICHLLSDAINRELGDAESKLWHAHPVWFLEGNPIVGYSRQKKGIRLMFWSGADFDEPLLAVRGEKFKDASVFFNAAEDIPLDDLVRWLGKSREIQWDYKNLVKRKGRLEKLK